MNLYDVRQGSDDWHDIREAALVTASDAGEWIYENDKRSIAARQKRIAQYLQREAYSGGDPDLLAIRDKKRRALDRDLAVQRGIKFEDEAMAEFEKLTGLETERVGVATTDDDLFVASPDRLIVGADEGVEGKVPLPETHLGYLIDNHRIGGMIDEYLHQVHFSLAVTGFDLWHFVSYAPPYRKAGKLVREPILHIRVQPGHITDKIRRGMAVMRAELARQRAILAEISHGQAKGLDTAIHAKRFSPLQ